MKLIQSWVCSAEYVLVKCCWTRSAHGKCVGTMFDQRLKIIYINLQKGECVLYTVCLSLSAVGIRGYDCDIGAYFQSLVYLQYYTKATKYRVLDSRQVTAMMGWSLGSTLLMSCIKMSFHGICAVALVWWHHIWILKCVELSWLQAEDLWLGPSKKTSDEKREHSYNAVLPSSSLSETPASWIAAIPRKRDAPGTGANAGLDMPFPELSSVSNPSEE